ncbi:MAG: hypothetical protein U5N10_02110 [Gemmobacter sp.]|nr:hypothetical protein [Gemmobacter sp.]
MRRGLSVHPRGAGCLCPAPRWTRAASDDRGRGLCAEVTPACSGREGGQPSRTTDEQPGNARPDKIPPLHPAFREGGTVTAANSSSISDGAAALVLMRQSQAEARAA